MNVYSEGPTYEETPWQDSIIYQTYIQPSNDSNGDAFVSSQPRRVFIAHQSEQVPFEPVNGDVPRDVCSPREQQLLQELDGMWSVLMKVQDYANMHGGLQATFLMYQPWNYLIGKDRDLPPGQDGKKDTILLINPCPLENYDVLIDLARRCPQYNFVVLSTWGAEGGNPRIRNNLPELPNIRIIESTCNMESVWDSVKIFLMSSLLCEAWVLWIVEAQIRGMLVIASNTGALQEPQMNIPHIIPDGHYNEEYNHKGPIVEEQDLDSLAAALDHLMLGQKE